MYHITKIDRKTQNYRNHQRLETKIKSIYIVFQEYEGQTKQYYLNREVKKKHNSNYFENYDKTQ